MNDLVVYDEVRAALERAESVDDLTEAKARIEAAATYARRRDLLPALLDGLELKLRCERRIGEVLAATVRRGNPNVAGTDNCLPEGVSRDQSSRWQRLARVPSEDFEQYIAQRREHEEEPTTAGALRLVVKAPDPAEGEKQCCPSCGRPLPAALQIDRPQRRNGK